MTIFTEKEIMSVPAEERQAMLNVNEKFFDASIEELEKEIAELDRRATKNLQGIRQENARRARRLAMTPEEKREELRVYKSGMSARFNSLAGLFE
tara:strand:- start:366 stop:650 length:285 start_codon:yes stop_codon:yes gene_type:complete